MKQNKTTCKHVLPKRVIDMRGQKFGKLTVMSFNGITNTGAQWLCQCECGNTTVVTRNHLVTGTTKSCGCLHQEQMLHSVIASCDYCGKEIRMKHYRYARSAHHYCCKKCFYLHKSKIFTASNNHQYGLKGPANASFSGSTIIRNNHHLKERMIYVGEWYIKSQNGRVKEHRYIVEKNHHLFNPKFFREINGWHYLRPGIDVHHIDFDHNNNQIDNLQPLTKEEHRKIHNRYKYLKKSKT